MSHAGARPGPHGVVAVVDDDPEIRQALAAWLALSGLLGAGHASAESLLAALLSDRGRLDLRVAEAPGAPLRLLGAVLDVKLPGGSGIDLARMLRGVAPELPLALVTALSAEEIARYGSPPAGVACLFKPFELDALEAALGELFARCEGEGGR